MTSDVVIIGGGVIGLSCAFYIARDAFGEESKKRIIVLDREPVVGAGATGKNAGGIRAQFSDETNIRYSLVSIDVFERFEEETGRQLEFHQCGYLFLHRSQEQVRLFAKQAELQRSLGVAIDILKPDDILKLAPCLRVDDVLQASFSKHDGIADPGDVVNGYYDACRRAGVEIMTGHTVTGIDLAGGAVTAVRTDKEIIHTLVVVNAAGPYAKDIAALAGYDLPVEAYKRQIVVSGPLDYIDEYFPMVVDVTSGVYFHRETPGLLMGWADPDVSPGYDESVDPEYTDEILMRTLDRLPRLEEAEIGRAWAGLYESTPDHRAVIGPAEGVNGFYLCNGFSGHGLMHAPAAGMVIADLIAGKTPRIDTTGFSPERFSKGALIHEANVI